MVVKSKRGLGRGIDALFEDNKETDVSIINSKNLLNITEIYAKIIVILINCNQFIIFISPLI
jgi:hypothetical protein